MNRPFTIERRKLPERKPPSERNGRIGQGIMPWKATDPEVRIRGSMQDLPMTNRASEGGGMIERRRKKERV